MERKVAMKEYEITLTYLNGCAGEAYPQITFDEAELSSPEEYIRAKHGKNADRFTREAGENGQVVFTFDNGAVKYIYEFTQL